MQVRPASPEPWSSALIKRNNYAPSELLRKADPVTAKIAAAHYLLTVRTRMHGPNQYNALHLYQYGSWNRWGSENEL
jgi:hypothetical protein